MTTRIEWTLSIAALGLVGCVSTNPNVAFDEVDKTVSWRTGERVRWPRADSERKEIAKAVEALLQTNLTAQTAVTITLLNNRALQAAFEEIGVSQADLAQACRF